MEYVQIGMEGLVDNTRYTDFLKAKEQVSQKRLYVRVKLKNKKLVKGKKIYRKDDLICVNKDKTIKTVEFKGFLGEDKNSVKELYYILNDNNLKFISLKSIAGTGKTVGLLTICADIAKKDDKRAFVMSVPSRNQSNQNAREEQLKKLGYISFVGGSGELEKGQRLISCVIDKLEEAVKSLKAQGYHVTVLVDECHKTVFDSTFRIEAINGAKNARRLANKVIDVSATPEVNRLATKYDYIVDFVRLDGGNNIAKFNKVLFDNAKQSLSYVALKAIERKERPLIFINNKERISKYIETFEKQGYKCLALSGGDRTKLSNSQLEAFKLLETKGTISKEYDIIFCTSVLEAGMSLKDDDLCPIMLVNSSYDMSINRIIQFFARPRTKVNEGYLLLKDMNSELDINSIQLHEECDIHSLFYDKLNEARALKSYYENKLSNYLKHGTSKQLAYSKFISEVTQAQSQFRNSISMLKLELSCEAKEPLEININNNSFTECFVDGYINKKLLDFNLDIKIDMSRVLIETIDERDSYYLENVKALDDVFLNEIKYDQATLIKIDDLKQDDMRAKEYEQGLTEKLSAKEKKERALAKKEQRQKEYSDGVEMINDKDFLDKLVPYLVETEGVRANLEAYNHDTVTSITGDIIASFKIEQLSSEELLELENFSSSQFGTLFKTGLKYNMSVEDLVELFNRKFEVTDDKGNTKEVFLEDSEYKGIFSHKYATTCNALDIIYGTNEVDKASIISNTVNSFKKGKRRVRLSKKLVTTLFCKLLLTSGKRAKLGTELLTGTYGKSKSDMKILDYLKKERTIYWQGSQHEEFLNDKIINEVYKMIEDISKESRTKTYKDDLFAKIKADISRFYTVGEDGVISASRKKFDLEYAILNR